MLVPATVVPDSLSPAVSPSGSGHEVVDELIRALINEETSERRLRLRAMRCDSTVLEADIRYPTASTWSATRFKRLVRIAGKAIEAVPDLTARVRDRGRAIGSRVRELSRDPAAQDGTGSLRGGATDP